MIVLGLTGSIAMGKTTTAKMFRNAGIPVHDADATVHGLYAGRAVPLIEAAFPGVVSDGIVDRKKLSVCVLGNQQALAKLEAIVHPLVQEEENLFLQRARQSGARYALLDIPLLFETGADKRVRATILVTASAEVQRQRALARLGMTDEKLRSILEKQMADEDKRKLAHFIIDTGRGMDPARRTAAAILRTLSFMV